MWDLAGIGVRFKQVKCTLGRIVKEVAVWIKVRFAGANVRELYGLVCLGLMEVRIR